MTTTYVIDGYNLLHAMGILLGKVKPPALERARLRLQDYLVSAFKEEAGQVTIVYDAARAPAKIAREQTYQGLAILLAVGQQEADDLIEVLIAQHASPKRLVVVSSDHRLQTAAKRKGARSMGALEFLDFVDGRRRPKPQAGPEEPEKNEQMSEKEINAWRQEFAGLESDKDLKEAFDSFDFEED